MAADLKKLLALVALIVVGTAVAVHGYVKSLDPDSLAAAPGRALVHETPSAPFLEPHRPSSLESARRAEASRRT